MHKPPSNPDTTSGAKTRDAVKPAPASAPEPQGSPRLPHERDEAVDPQRPSTAEPTQREIGQAAHDDVERGAVDTDRGPVAERTYQRQKRPER